MSNFINGPNNCWEWKKSKAGNGYGVLSFYKRNYYVHRLSYRLFIGEIPNGLFVCHKCDNPACFNPDHLFLGTAKDNVNDMIKKGRKVVSDNRGSKNPRCKFSDETVLNIRKDFESGLTKKELVNTYQVSDAQFYRITRYKTRPELKVK